MGSSQSILSPEAAVTLAVVAGAVGFGYNQFAQSSASTEPPAKKGKKKKKASALTQHTPEVIPGGFQDTTTTPVASKKKKKNKLASSTTSSAPKPNDTPTAQPSTQTPPKPNTKQPIPISSPSHTRQLPSSKIQSSSVSNDTDSSWTRVESRRNKFASTSGRSADLDVTTTSASEAGTSSPVAGRHTDLELDVDDEEEHVFYTRPTNIEERRPLAERMMPKPRKTGVESMLETPDHHPLARVMRVQGAEPADGFSWGDYEDAHDADADGEDDNAGWDVVKSKSRRARVPPSDPSDPQQTQATIKAQTKAPETLTKRQRQNAARREAQKGAKEEAERERRATLARYQREMEGERAREQARQQGKGKKVSGGMKAVVEGGKLVWE